jgi:hydroxypyruvate reductase
VPKIGAERFQNAVLRRLGNLGEQACQVMAAAIDAVDPYACVQSHLEFGGSTLTIAQASINLDEIGRIYLLGLGKASVPMAMAVLDCLGDRVDGAFVVTKDEKFLAQNGYRDKLHVYQGAHPVPDERSITSTKAVLNQIPQLNAEDLVIVVISGGGSALFTYPIEGVSLGDLQDLTTLLLRSGADIQEINTIRKHLDRVKGGRLSALLAPAQIQTLILSDVIGDDLDMIASGPTVADSTTYADAWRIVQKYDLEELIPKSVRNALQMGAEGELPETVKPAQMRNLRTQNHLVGTNQLAAEAARAMAEQLGFEAEILTTTLTGLTEKVALDLADLADQMIARREKSPAPLCLILGGETTVNVSGDGLGGRNQDLAIRMAPLLAGKPGVLFISLATDGEDGPTDAAGGVMAGDVMREGEEELGLDVAAYIANSDAYHYLKKTGALIKIGATGTNVNDLILMFIDKESD